jgi:hypothetical protein
MLRTSLNMDYYHDLYDLATDFGVEVEAHRKSSPCCRVMKIENGNTWLRSRSGDEIGQ